MITDIPYDVGKLFYDKAVQRHTEAPFKLMGETADHNDSGSYIRISTHPMPFGIDLNERQYIKTARETFRHVLFGVPIPQSMYNAFITKDGVNTKGIADKMKSDKAHKLDFAKGLVDYFSDDNEKKYQKEKFIMMIKPESYGTQDVGHKVMHALDYVSTRLDSGYKKTPFYYGEFCNRGAFHAAWGDESSVIKKETKTDKRLTVDDLDLDDDWYYVPSND